MSEFKYIPEQLKTFWWWINERHAIYLKRKAGKEAPWTKDKVLQDYKFTNPFRQLDRVTQAWIDRYVYLLGVDVNLRENNNTTYRKIPPTDGDILFHVALFRLFNWPATYDALYYMSRQWSYGAAMKILEERRANKEQIFTGAYIVPNMGLSDPKIDIIAAAVDLVHENRHDMAKYIRWSRSIEQTCEVLQLVPTIGPFIAYEIACDLRYTRILADCTDANTWANPGPGAKRGIHRLLTGSFRSTGARPDYLAVMRNLLKRSRGRGALGKDVLACEWPFEMREIEHSLCEFDKYMRVKMGEGRPRSRFRPTPGPPWDVDKPIEKASVVLSHTEAVKKFLSKSKRKKGVSK